MFEDNEPFVPKYIKVERWIENFIQRKNLKKGDILPSENKLTKELKVGKNTVRQALLNLSNRGVIYRIQGKGTFVNRRENDSSTSLIDENSIEEHFSNLILGKYIKASRTKTDVNILIWSETKEERELEKKIFKLVKDRLPNINLVVEYVSPYNYLKKLEIMEKEGRIFDIVFCEVTIMPFLVEKNILLDLTELINKDREINITDYYPQIIKRFSRHGKIFAIPRDIAPYACLFYNKKIFDESGVPYPKGNWDFKQFLDVAIKLTKIKNGEIIQYGYVGVDWWNFIFCNGGNLVDNVENPTRCTLDSKEAIEGLNFFADMVKKYKVTISLAPSEERTHRFAQLFIDGKAAMYHFGSFMIPTFKKIKEFDWSFTLFPRNNIKEGKYFSGGSGLGIYKKSKNIKEAWEVIKVLCGEESQKILAKDDLFLPANINISKNILLEKDKKYSKKLLVDAIENIIFTPYTKYWPEICEIMLIEFNKAFNGNESVEKVVKNVVSLINNFLSQENKLNVTNLLMG